jgi:cyclopropane-fatty-acyl-phospholipid synthase
MFGLKLAESGRVPDFVIRAAIRVLLRRRLNEVKSGDCEADEAANHAFREQLRASPIALVPELANQQHYEVAPEFFERVLGWRMKYSCGLWSEGVRDIDAAEEAMLALVCSRAQLTDGMSVLDLGCGWGSLSLWIAERYPKCRVLAVSNSKPQREFILARCAERGIENVEVVTSDINQFDPDQRFDRVISIEMFEHIRNYEWLLARIAKWLKPNGKLFVHRDLVVEHKWRVNGTHYKQTAEAWLHLQDVQIDLLIPILAKVYGEKDARLWFERWRLFFLACAELFGYRGGNEWWVTHVRMSRREGAQ